MLFRRLNARRQRQFRGSSIQVALLVAAAFAAGAVLATAVDWYSGIGLDAPVLQAWTLIPQTVAAGGLYMLGRAQRSRSYSILAALILLVVVEEAFHVLNPVAARLTTVADWANEWTGVSTGVLAEVLLYGLVAAIGFALLAISYWYGSWNERLAVRTIMMLLLIGGLFAGPVSMLSSADQGGRWLYIEELGEGLAFSLIAGYVLGLIVSESAARSTGVPRS